MKDIYYDPLSEKSVFVGGQLVAPCKMSNGAKIANQGYVRVSLGVTCHYFVIMLRLFILHSGHNISFLILLRHMDEAQRGNLKRKLNRDHDSETTKRLRHA
ncbi:hypothetical protein Bca52824_075884 [Brassica carinata]|uniref:Uncharacterized protein n=1 Tax=Brassica carinata TaxID=52824 RepID=A0A8X7TVU7_BRACI|nr:hypothetical protein Bca52824_075884 [Brassica carinata]